MKKVVIFQDKVAILLVKVTILENCHFAKKLYYYKIVMILEDVILLKSSNLNRNLTNRMLNVI